MFVPLTVCPEPSNGWALVVASWISIYCWNRAVQLLSRFSVRYRHSWHLHKYLWGVGSVVIGLVSNSCKDKFSRLWHFVFQAIYELCCLVRLVYSGFVHLRSIDGRNLRSHHPMNCGHYLFAESQELKKEIDLSVNWIDCSCLQHYTKLWTRSASILILHWAS